MVGNRNSLGTLLRHLIDLLDGEVQRAYDQAGLDYRPRYTPVVRAIEALGPASIRALACHAGLTHSAVSQTVAQMARAGLIEFGAGRDGRERIVSAAPALTAMLPHLHRLWAATSRASDSLDEDLPYPLTLLVAEAVRTLETKSFGERIQDGEHVTC